MKNWFEGINTLEELKRAYRKLAIQHHPDKGGRTEDMQEINAQYDVLATKLPLTNAKGETYQPAPEKREAPEEFRAAVMAAINLDGVELEMCGRWIWATGNTKAHKDALKAAGYRWSANKGAWYWRNAKDAGRLTRRDWTLDEIRSKFGSDSLKASDPKRADMLHA